MHTDLHGRHIYSTTVCLDPEILLPWECDVTTSLFQGFDWENFGDLDR